MANRIFLITQFIEKQKSGDELKEFSETVDVPTRERLREVQEALEETLTGGDRVSDIVRDLKTFSRGGRGEGRPGEPPRRAGPVREHRSGPDPAPRHPGEGLRGAAAHPCQRVPTGLGGRITVESQPGQGSTFRVFLPEGKD